MNKMILFAFTEIKSPIGSPVINPPRPHETPHKINEKEIPFGFAPRLFIMAISFLRSITIIIIADDIFTVATRIISIIIKMSITFVELKLENSAR